MNYPRVIENLIEQLMKLPGVGRRSAERMVFWLLNNPPEEAARLSGCVSELKNKLRFCKLCNNFSEEEVCPVCMDARRDPHTICIVENPKDAMAIEKTGIFKGQYYVLLGTISPSEGQGPDDLDIGKLISKIRADQVTEVVLATDADIEGELTALHIIKMLQPYNLKVSRIGIGLPAGGAVEFADMSTLAMSFTSRRDVLQKTPQDEPQPQWS
jgi:recombination protein RecR